MNQPCSCAENCRFFIPIDDIFRIHKILSSAAYQIKPIRTISHMPIFDNRKLINITNSLLNENIVLTNTYSAVPYDYDAEFRKAQADAEAENDAKRCYELAWQNGWKAAMKYVEAHSRAQNCEYCGKEGKTKKCGGTCNGKVRYCSVECQTADWKQVHKYACFKHTF